MFRGPDGDIYIYIGLATNQDGMMTRVKQHQKGSNTATNIKLITEAGAELIHFAWLCHRPIPRAADVPKLRLATLAVEAAFSCIFWAMLRTDRSCGLDGMCP